MSNTAKIWLIAAVFLIVVGLILFIAVIFMNGNKLESLNTDKYVTNTHTISESFSDISIKTNTADIVFLPSEDETCTVVCYENETHNVGVENGTLTIGLEHKKKWYEYIAFSFSSSKITVYLPQNEYQYLFVKSDTGSIEIPENFRFESVEISSHTGKAKFYADAENSVKITTTTGAITVEKTYANSMEISVTTGSVTIKDVTCSENLTISVSTGKAKLTNVICNELHSGGDTGDITLTNVLAAELIHIRRDTGDVKFEHCDAGRLNVQTDTGDITGSLRTAKIFSADSDTGSVGVPKSTTGGLCEIKTDTGDIKITIEE